MQHCNLSFRQKFVTKLLKNSSFPSVYLCDELYFSISYLDECNMVQVTCIGILCLHDYQL